MNILIYGAGAVGLGLASCLLKSGTEVDIIAREDTVKALNKHGLVRTGMFGDYTAGPASFCSYALLDKIPKKIYDYIIVSIKSCDSLIAAEEIAKHNSIRDSNTKIILFQNGWGNAEIFAKFLPKEHIYNARVITGFVRLSKNQVEITVHAEPIHIGSIFKTDILGLKNICNLIDRGGIPCEAVYDVEKDLWSKMLYNCCLNSLGAICDVPYGYLGKSQYIKNIMHKLVEEIFLVMKAAGYKTHVESSKDYLNLFYSKLLPATAKHESSTLQDIHRNKKTEIDSLNGAVIKLAEKFKVSVPYNFTVYNLVKFIEAKQFIKTKI